MSRVRRSISVAVATLVGAVLLYFSLRGIEWNDVWRSIAGADPLTLGVAALLACVTLFLRSLRWRVLLNAEGRVSVASAFWATATGYFGNNFLPFRAGELARVHMVWHEGTMPHAFVLATVIFERVADAIVLTAIGAIATMTVASGPGWLGSAARTLGGLALLGALVLAAIPLLETPLTRSIAAAPLPSGLRQPVLTTLGHCVKGMRAFHDAGRLARFLACTVAIWGIDAFAAVLGAHALGMHMPVPAAILLLAGLGLGSALPATPGYVGIYQFVAVSVLTPFGFSRGGAIAYITVAQALSFAVIGLWGSLALLRHRRQSREPRIWPT